MMTTSRLSTLLLHRRCCLPLPNISRSLSSFNDTAVEEAARRSAVAEARRSRVAELAQKQDDLERHLERHSANSGTKDPSENDSPQAPPSDIQEEETDAIISLERSALLAEAGSMTRSLYRTCLRSVTVLRPGNDRDDADFAEREKAQLKMFDDDGDDRNAGTDKGTASMASPFSPPVDRENELESRAEYYAEWARENFAQEMDCLATNPWREDDVERYLHFLRVGEERRKWVLKDYGFEDPFEDRFDTGRVDRFEARATEFLSDSYGSRGWLLQHELDESERRREGEECIFDSDEDFSRDPPDPPTADGK